MNPLQSPAAAPAASIPAPVPPHRAPGVILAGLLGATGMLLAETSWAQSLGLSALTLSVLLGILGGNSFFPALAGRAGSGVDFTRTTLLRAGVVLYGLRITFQQIAGVGATGVLIDAVMLSATFLLAAFLGPRLFKLDRDTSILIGAGSAICGAAAVVGRLPKPGFARPRDG